MRNIGFFQGFADQHFINCQGMHIRGIYDYVYSKTCLERTPLWSDHPVWKDHFPICEDFYLPFDSMQTKPFLNDHLSGKTTFS